jgi:hypothetical protein
LSTRVRQTTTTSLSKQIKKAYRSVPVTLISIETFALHMSFKAQFSMAI